MHLYNVNYVKQIFTGFELGDTIRVVDGKNVVVPDLSQIFLFIQSLNSKVLPAIEEMYTLDATINAEPNFISIADRTPVDDYWEEQWNLKDEGVGIGCETGWNSSTGSTSVKVAILDSGIDYYHADLGGPSYPNAKVAGGHDYAYNDNDPMDNFGHGTACAGIAGALSNNSQAVAGIGGGWYPDNTGVKLYAIKVLGDDGRGYDDAIANGIYAAADPNQYGCQILSNSYGKYQYSEVLRSAINFAYRLGASFVAAKGNDGSLDPHYPADFDHTWVTAVGSYGLYGNYCGYDFCGYESNYWCGIDVLAPGYRIPTTDLDNAVWQDFGGTSAACPHVSGSIGLIRSVKTGLRNEDTDWMIKFSAKDDYFGGDHNVWTWNGSYGHGDLRVSTLMQRLGSPYQNPLYKLYGYTASGGVEASHTGFYRATFLGSPLSGVYFVRRYDVRVNVTYPRQFLGIPFVWGVGYNTSGWSGANPNYQVGYCELVPGTQSSTGCQLQTYVYDVYDIMGGHVGWYPCHVNQVSLRYKVWGIPNDQPTRPDIDPKIDSDNIPFQLSLEPAYPNPFNNSATIRFVLPQESKTTLDIYDVLGRKVATLFDGIASEGEHLVTWRAGDDLGSGIYFCRLQSNENQQTQKITLLR